MKNVTSIFATLLVFISIPIHAMPNEAQHHDLTYYDYDCLQVNSYGLDDYPSKIREIVSNELNKAGLRLRTAEIAKNNPASSLQTASLCFVLQTYKTEEGYALFYMLEIRQFSFLVKDIQKYKNLAEPLKLNTATYYFNHYYPLNNIDNVLNEIKTTAKQIGSDLSKLNSISK